ncbi:trypsin, alkaline B-like [Pararge aegeria]|uniref:trypsin, alkaline B-like n=1 Tax=Pararge aegeria TaxID=116150 RepID=UPI0019D0627A|nr:trypsin, alkaline B-like [Pararge aegeria]
MRALFVLIIELASIAAVLAAPSRIVGGSKVSIKHYPMGAAMLFSRGGVGNFVQTCGGAIINNRAIVSASHCYTGDPAVRWRARVGSTKAHSGGVVHNTARIYHHPDFNAFNTDSDVAVLHVTVPFSFNNYVQPAYIAGAYYHLGDNKVVWAIGWGYTSFWGQPSEHLQHVQIWTVNQTICVQRYAEIGRVVTDNMLCSGWLDVGGRDQCQGDSGGPLLHNNIVVGVSSWGYQCALPRYPGVSTRISQFAKWIVEHA